MTFDEFLFIVALILLFTLIFGSVYFLPIAITILRSKIFGLKISLGQAKILVKNKCVSKVFLIGVKNVWEVYPIQLDKLVNHYFAGGDLNNIKNGVSEMIKREKEPNINILTTLDLAKRDLKSEVEKAERNNWNFEF